MPKAEYVIRVRVVTEAAPKEVVSWSEVEYAVARLFKRRPPLAVAVVSILMEQVPATKLPSASDDSAP